MRELLDTPTQRRLHILEQLNEVSNWISSNELAKSNNASLRTINNDVSYLKENWYPHLLIETSKKNGVRLQTQPSSHIEVVYRYVLKNSEAFRLIESVFFDTTLSIEKWGEKLFISESSLYRITGDVSKSLKKYGLTLEKKPFRVIGKDEFFVRFFYTNYFFEAYQINEWPFPSDKKKTIQFVKDIVEYFNEEVSEKDLLLISYLLCISLTRQSQEFFIEGYDKNIFTKEMYHSLNRNANDLANIAKDYGLLINDQLIYDLMFSLYYHLINWHSEEEYLHVTKEIKHLMKNIRNVFDFTLTNQLSDKIENSMKHTYLKHTIYPYPNYIIFNKKFYNAIAIKKLFPTMALVIEQELIKLEKSTDFPWYTDYFYEVLCTIMIQWTDLPTLLENKKQKAKILVMSSLGYDHSDFLSKMIQKNFVNKAIIEAYTQSVIFIDDIPKEYFQSYDIIISTFDSEILPQDKLVVIDDIPSNSDWGTIRRAINNTHQLDEKVVTYLNNNYY